MVGVILAVPTLAAGPVVAGYDPLAWLAWGREVARLDLHTAEGPAFKPLPVLLVAPVAGVLGDEAALHWWLLLARAATVAAVCVAAVLAWRTVRAATPPAGEAGARATGTLAPATAAVLAALAIGLTGDWWRHGLPGGSEPLVALAGLAAVVEHRAGRPGRAWAWVTVAVLLRAESWPFAVLYGAWLAWSRTGGRRLAAGVAATALALPLLWVGAEWWGSGDPGRSSDRARIPNPGQPALDDRPFLASLAEGVPLALWPLLLLIPLGAAGLRRDGVRGPARDSVVLVVLGAGWVLLVAGMSEWGYSGEARYHLPGVGLLGVAGAVMAGRLLARPGGPAAAAGLAVVLVVTAGVAVARVGDAADDWRRADADARLQRSLWRAVERAGGRRSVLACGRPVIGRFRAPQLAWPLDVPKATVDEDPRPAPSVVFRGPLAPGGLASPAVPAGHAPVARAGPWTVHARCRPGR